MVKHKFLMTVASVLSVVLTGLTGTAHAAASAEARLTSLSYQLFDVNGDPLATGVVFTRSPRSLAAVGFDGLSQIAFDLGAAPASPAAVSLAQPNGAAAAEVGADFLGAQASIFSFGDVVAGAAISNPLTGGALNFRLRAHTAIVWTADYSFAAATTELGDVALAIGALQLDVAGDSEQDSFGAFAADGSADAATGQLTVSYFNAGNRAVTGTFQAVALAVVQSVAAPVPEPETYALLLAGIGLIGWTIYRRKS